MILLESAPFVLTLFVVDVVALHYLRHVRVAYGDYAICRSRSYVEHHAVELASNCFDELTTSSQIGSPDDRGAKRRS